MIYPLPQFKKKKQKNVHHLKNKNCCSIHKNVTELSCFFSLLIVCYIDSYDFLYSPKIFLKKKEKSLEKQDLIFFNMADC